MHLSLSLSLTVPLLLLSSPPFKKNSEVPSGRLDLISWRAFILLCGTYTFGN